MGVKTSLPNTAKRFAQALGVTGTTLKTSLPNSMRRLEAALGAPLTKRTTFPNTAKRIAAECGFGGGGGTYHADAVHFDGSTFLTLDSITQASSGPGYSFSCWTKLGDLAFSPNLFAVLIPEDHTTSFASVPMRTPTAAGHAFVGQGCWDATFTDFLAGQSPNDSWTPSTWVNVAIAVKTNLSAGNKLQKIVISGANQTISGVFDTDPSFAIDYSGQTLCIPDDPNDASLLVGDMADFQLWLGQYIDWSSAGNLSKIISGGKPVDPATAATAFGAQTILLSGDSTGFATNQGTGGAFTLTGSLTNASSSPSD